MTSKEKKSIFILQSIHQVLKAEKLLKKKDMPFRLVPVPKQINSNCGIALEVAPIEAAHVREVMIEGKINIKAQYLRQGEDFTENT